MDELVIRNRLWKCSASAAEKFRSGSEIRSSIFSVFFSSEQEDTEIPEVKELSSKVAKEKTKKKNQLALKLWKEKRKVPWGLNFTKGENEIPPVFASISLEYLKRSYLWVPIHVRALA